MVSHCATHILEEQLVCEQVGLALTCTGTAHLSENLPCLLMLIQLEHLVDLLVEARLRRRLRCAAGSTAAMHRRCTLARVVVGRSGRVVSGLLL